MSVIHHGFVASCDLCCDLHKCERDAFQTNEMYSLSKEEIE